MSGANEGMLAEARERLNPQARVLVFSGAGVSAESGVPTFRGEDGLWKQFRAEELATPSAFARDPRLVWEWYGWRRELVAECHPNAAHRAIAARQGSGRCKVVTQNVDGLHAKALADPASGEIIELHGSLYRVRCTYCEFTSADRTPVDATTRESCPHCPECGHLLRPDIVWFGEALREGALETAFGSAASADVCLVVGTSGRVEPAASIPRVAAEGGAFVVVVNPEPTPLDHVAAAVFRGSATEFVPKLLL